MEVKVGFTEARARVLGAVRPLPAVRLPLLDALDHALAADVCAEVDAPSGSTSLRDGAAVRAAEVARASDATPIALRVAASTVAGGPPAAPPGPGEAVRVTTGAVLPMGMDAVVEVEGLEFRDDLAIVRRSVPPGRNVLAAGADVARGERVAVAGEVLCPGRLALLAAAGVAEVRVVPRPRVGIVSTGDEVIAPGGRLQPGQVYASNLVLACGWVHRYGMCATSRVVRDDPAVLAEALRDALERSDAVLTAGGAWGSERDLTVRAATSLGGEVLFHRVRLGPGKAIALVLVDDKPLFCLPGGPPSFEAALLHLALPALLRMAGREPEPFPRRRLRLPEAVRAEPGWTRSFGCEIVEGRDGDAIRTRGTRSRLLPDPAVLLTPEGGAAEGEAVDVLDLRDARWG